MLLALLVLVSSAAFFAGAIAAAAQAHSSVIGYFLAGVVGLILAASNAWVVQKTGDLLGDLTQSYSETKQEWFGRAFYLLIIIWLPFAALFGQSAAFAAMRLAR